MLILGSAMVWAITLMVIKILTHFQSSVTITFLDVTHRELRAGGGQRLGLAQRRKSAVAGGHRRRWARWGRLR